MHGLGGNGANFKQMFTKGLGGSLDNFENKFLHKTDQNLILKIPSSCKVICPTAPTKDVFGT